MTKETNQLKQRVTLHSLKRLISPGIRHKVVSFVNEQSIRILRGKVGETGANCTVAENDPTVTLDSGIQLSVR